MSTLRERARIDEWLRRRDRFGLAEVRSPPGGQKVGVADLDLKLKPVTEAARLARRRVRELSLEREVSEVIELLVTELVANAVFHGSNDDSTIDVRLIASKSVVRLEVANAGTGFTPSSVAREGPRPGGLGLVLVEKLADRWGIEGGDTTRVWLEVHCKGP